MNFLKLPLQEYLLECFEYNENVGVLSWKERPNHHFSNDADHKWFCTKYGWKIAGTINKRTNYTIVRLDGIDYKAHRLIYKLYHGIEPDLEVDHTNRNKQDNRIENLRLVTRGENERNKGPTSKNTSGYKNISFYKKTNKYRVEITKDRKHYHIGYFENIEDAIIARNEALIIYHGDFACL